MKSWSIPFGVVIALSVAACDKSQAEAPKADNPAPAKVAEPGAPADKAAEPATSAPAEAKTDAIAEVGRAAPEFALKDLDGKEHKLSDYKGKTVVLEWYNPDCPFVVKQHNEGPLKTFAKDLAKNGFVYLAINSGAPGKQGAGLERNKTSLTEYGIEHPVLLDEDGKVGKAYKSRNTPHMYVIDPTGTLAYAGAIDNAPMGKIPDSGFVNHVADALADLDAKRAVTVAETKAYGCSVKYAD